MSLVPYDLALVLQPHGIKRLLDIICDAYLELKNSKYCFQYAEYLIPAKHKKPIFKASNIWDPALLPSSSTPNSESNSNIITNDADLHYCRNLLITGPNAAGKSTYIKSLALNVLLAQTIGLVPASSLKITPFHVINTYLNIPDCIGKSSLFEAEMFRAKEHLELINNLPKDKHAFVIMDEIFSSTNYVEGFSAA